MEEEKEEVVEKEDTVDKFLKWKALNPETPLFLPTGSVRALLALSMVIIIGAMLFHGMTVPEFMISLLSSCVGFYFGSRGADKK